MAKPSKDASPSSPYDKAVETLQSGDKAEIKLKDVGDDENIARNVLRLAAMAAGKEVTLRSTPTKVIAEVVTTPEGQGG